MRTLFVILFFLLITRPAFAETMSFASFGFSVDVPQKFGTCAPFDNGVGFYIDGKAADKDCKIDPDRRMITVSGESDPEFSLGLSAAQQCDYLADYGSYSTSGPNFKWRRRTGMPVPSLELGHRNSYSCELDGNDGMNLLVITECGPPLPTTNAPEAVCSAWMHTLPHSFEADLRTFRKIIASVKFVPFERDKDMPALHLLGPAGLCPDNWYRIPEGQAYTLHDPRSGLTLHLEGDQRHINATDATGNVVWRRNPFVDAHLSPYRVAHPRIMELAVLPDCAIPRNNDARLQGHYIFVMFDSSQSGVLDAQNGNFFFEGQN